MLKNTHCKDFLWQSHVPATFLDDFFADKIITLAKAVAEP